MTETQGSCVKLWTRKGQAGCPGGRGAVSPPPSREQSSAEASAAWTESRAAVTDVGWVDRSVLQNSPSATRHSVPHSRQPCVSFTVRKYA